MKRSLAFWLLLAMVSPPRIWAQTRYFPEGAFASDGQKSRDSAEHLTKLLRALKEPPLWEVRDDKSAEVYRFTWCRTFDHPLSVRLTIQKDGSGILTTRILSGKCGYGWGKLVTNRTARLPKQQVAAFRKQTEELRFWSQPSYVEEDVIRLDGADWIMEGVKDGHYHVVDRWSPESSTERAFGITMMIDLANLKLLYQDVY